jgi:rRNA maturation protein Nop10
MCDRSTTLTCSECGADVVVRVFDVCEDYAEADMPDACPECGADARDAYEADCGDSDYSARQSERRQMGIGA